MDTVKQIKILKITDNVPEEKLDSIVVEKPINIFVNFEFYAALMCSPSELKELAAGFLFSEGVISSAADIKSIEEKYGDRVCVVLNHEFSKDSESVRARSTGCGNGSIRLNKLENRSFSPAEDGNRFTAESIAGFMKEFNHMSGVFRETGGVHSCAICGGGGIECFSEDIGRHNALDKVIGKAILKGIDLKKRVILTTGRISSDIVLKAAGAGLPMVVSHSAPTDLALEIAEAANITVLGFVRGNRMNVYCCSKRIIS
jgi:FdhD protein